MINKLNKYKIHYKCNVHQFKNLQQMSTTITTNIVLTNVLQRNKNRFNIQIKFCIYFITLKF